VDSERRSDVVLVEPPRVLVKPPPPPTSVKVEDETTLDGLELRIGAEPVTLGLVEVLSGTEPPALELAAAVVGADPEPPPTLLVPPVGFTVTVALYDDSASRMLAGTGATLNPRLEHSSLLS